MAIEGQEQTDVQEPESSTGVSTSEETSPAVETPEEGAQETATETPAEPQAEPETVPPTSPPGTPPVHQGDVDEMGVPWKNRYHESQRKLDKVLEQQDALLQKVDQNQGQKGGEYSIEELEAFLETETGQQPANKQWAKSEIRRLQKEEVASGVRAEFEKQRATQQAEAARTNAFQTVMQRYPDAFKKDASGNIVGWDPQSPMAQRISQYMQDPELKNNPRGLLVAAAMAYSDLGQTAVQTATKQTTQAKAEVKNLQKKTLTEGGGVSSPPKPKTPLNTAKEKLAQSGSIKDGAAVFKEGLKSRGRISED